MTTQNETYWRRCGVPFRLRNATFDNYETPTPGHQTALDAMREFSGPKRRHLFAVLCGPSGTGKSHLAAASLKAFGHGAFVTVDRVCDLARVKRVELGRTLRTCRLLVVDEFGSTPSDPSFLSVILSERHDCYRPTILISNLAPVALAALLPARVSQRIAESKGGICLVVPALNEDFRAKLKEPIHAPADDVEFNGELPPAPATPGLVNMSIQDSIPMGYEPPGWEEFRVAWGYAPFQTQAKFVSQCVRDNYERWKRGEKPEHMETAKS